MVSTMLRYTSISMQSLVIQFIISYVFYVVESQCLKSLNIKIYLFIIKWLKLFCCYNSHEVSLCGCRIYSLYIDAVVVLDRCVHTGPVPSGNGLPKRQVVFLVLCQIHFLCNCSLCLTGHKSAFGGSPNLFFVLGTGMSQTNSSTNNLPLGDNVVASDEFRNATFTRR